MKTPLLLLLTLLIAGCTFTDRQKESAARVGGFSLTVLQRAADIAAQIIIARAVDNSDLADKSGLLNSAALGLRSLECYSGGLVTPQLVGTTIRQFTDPSKSHWSDYANKMAAEYAKSTLPQDKKLESLARGSDSAAATALVSLVP